MSFYSEVDDMKVVERNIDRLVSMEKRASAKILKIFQEGRARMRVAMAAAGTDTFTEAQIELTMSQVDAIVQAMEFAARSESSQATDVMIEQSVEDLGKEISRFSKRFEGISRVIPIDAIIHSMEGKNLLLNTFQASIQSYTKEFRDFVQRELTQHILSAEPTNKLSNRILDEWSLKDWKVLRIVRTELHNVYNQSKNKGMFRVKADLIPDLQKTLIHPLDGRTAKDSLLARELELVVDIDKPFRYNFEGKERVFFAPPDRPNDRSILVPFREEWKDK